MSYLTLCRFGNRISASEGQLPLSAEAEGPGTLSTQVVDFADGAAAVYYHARCSPALVSSTPLYRVKGLPIISVNILLT